MQLGQCMALGGYNAGMEIGQITGLVLAGGQASRMGGVDKGWQVLRGEPLVRHVIRRLAPQVGAVMISANRNTEAYAALGLPVWPDAQPGFAGPLAGLQAGLAQCATPYLLSVPCDSPFLPLDLAARLAEALQARQAEVAVAVTGAGADRRTQPVFCLLKTALLPHLTGYLDSGGRKFEAWHALLNVAEVDFPNAADFRNINTQQDLLRWQQD
jgi:molybdopterin-guanine dinucleotide biosynthesis protein A